MSTHLVTTNQTPDNLEQPFTSEEMRTVLTVKDRVMIAEKMVSSIPEVVLRYHNIGVGTELLTDDLLQVIGKILDMESLFLLTLNNAAYRTSALTTTSTEHTMNTRSEGK